MLLEPLAGASAPAPAVGRALNADHAQPVIIRVGSGIANGGTVSFCSVRTETECHVMILFVRVRFLQAKPFDF